MAKEDLENIKHNIKRARQYWKQAEDTARRVGDNSGAGKLANVDKEMEKTEKEFDKAL